MIFPKSIKPGGRIGIISPATEVKREYVEGAARVLEGLGYEPVVGAHASGPRCGSYAASLDERLADWLGALEDESIEGILCARGGYGCVQLAASTPRELLLRRPKWVVGFSDVSALHALLNSAGIASIHGPMAKHLCDEGTDDECTRMLLRLLSEGLPLEVEAAGCELNSEGAARGRLVGGNFAVLSDLAATPFDMLSAPLREDCVLFLEDISEPLYALDRMLWRLYLSGALSRAKALLIGQFTEYRADANFATAEELIHWRLAQWGLEHIPAAYDFPCGHVRGNYAMPVGAMADVEIGKEGVKIRYREQ